MRERERKRLDKEGSLNRCWYAISSHHIPLLVFFIHIHTSWDCNISALSSPKNWCWGSNLKGKRGERGEWADRMDDCRSLQTGGTTCVYDTLEWIGLRYDLMTSRIRPSHYPSSFLLYFVYTPLLFQPSRTLQSSTPTATIGLLFVTLFRMYTIKHRGEGKHQD